MCSVASASSSLSGGHSTAQDTGAVWAQLQAAVPLLAVDAVCTLGVFGDSEGPSTAAVLTPAAVVSALAVSTSIDAVSQSELEASGMPPQLA